MPDVIDDLKGKKFLQIRTLAHRWDCSTSTIYDMISKGLLRAWHPEGKAGCKGVKIDVGSIVSLEESGYLDVG